MTDVSGKRIEEGKAVIDKRSEEWGIVVWADENTGLVAVDFGEGKVKEVNPKVLKVA